ncbi:MAG: hemerythrin domain-containing protein [Acidobacteria bacterium]|nr:hemerythrin domain-containing protein [Acidobacteriota bacterium]
MSPFDHGQSKTSFLALLRVHEALTELFLTHQEALLDADLDAAQQLLSQFRRRLLAHMTEEEQRLLPIFQERNANVPGGGVELFLAEHRRMRQMLDEIQEALKRIAEESGLQRRRKIIALLDQEAMFKRLAEHHDEREKNILYPRLDQITTTEERALLFPGESGNV